MDYGNINRGNHFDIAHPLGRPLGISQQKESLEALLDLPDSMSHVRELHEPAQTNSSTPLQSITEVSAARPPTQEDKLAQEANLYIQRPHDKPSYGNYYPYYYENLKDSIEELRELKNEHQIYITQGGDSKDKPRSYLPLIEEIQTPMPFKSFTEARPTSASNAAYVYLWLEKSVLNQLQGAMSSSENTSAKKTENYELHQQRITNTLTTINDSELNPRLAFINLYLQASESRIKQETDPIEKEALLDRPVKFLDANLISPKENSFPSEDAAQKYADKLSETIVHIKEINEEFSESNTSMFKTDDEESPVNSLYFFRNSLINKILDQSKGLITVNNLGPAFKERFLEDSNLKNILGKDLIIELKNGILIENLKESKDNRSFFFQFLNQMIVKTPEIFTKFQNTEIPNDNNQFKEFKNLLLNHLELPSTNTAKNTPMPINMKKFEFMQIESADAQDAGTHLTMGRSLLRLMQFKDIDIKETAKEFYIKAIKEAKSINCINGLLQPLSSIESLHSEKANEPSVYDLVPFKREDLAEYLQQNYVIKKHHLEQMMGNRVPQRNPSDDLNLLDTYEKILGISAFTQDHSNTNTPSTFLSKLATILSFRASK